MTSEEERDLAKKAKTDPEAFGRLYDQYYSRIFGYVLKRTGNLETSQDVVSETFLKALKNVRKFQWQSFFGRKPMFGAWLYRIASNEIANFFRKKKPTISLNSVLDPVFEKDLFGEVVAAEQRLKDCQDFLCIQKEIMTLPEKYQQVLVLRFFEKKQIKEIAEILGKREGTVKSLIHRGLKYLKAKMPPT
ncbi:MAG: RNA polymerase sigma factor [bacterium]|nr:RNA polymerase sigma factor [bacterium]